MASLFICAQGAGQLLGLRGDEKAAAMSLCDRRGGLASTYERSELVTRERVLNIFVLKLFHDNLRTNIF